LSFGLGQHFCVGAPLARIEAVELLNAFLDRFAPGEIRLTPDFELEWMPMPYMLGPKRLEIEIP
jgi:cytochrome P450